MNTATLRTASTRPEPATTPTLTAPLPLPEVAPAHIRTAIMVVVVLLSPLALWISWDLLAASQIPEPRNSIYTWADLALGVAAIAMLPRVLHRDAGAPTWAVDTTRERRALTYGIATMLCAAPSGMALPAAVVAAVSVAGRRRPVWIICAVSAAMFVFGYKDGRSDAHGIGPDVPDLLELGMVMTIITSVVMLGLYLGGRRDLLAALRREADAARSSQAAREVAARQQERTRIAREMHDALSHRLALVALHAGALEYRDDLSSQALRDAVCVIRDGAYAAQEDLRATLTVLRSDCDDTRPAPTLADIEIVIEQVRTTGTQIDLRTDLPHDAALPAAASAHLYRVVQESLTNAVKHAPGSPISVVLEGGPEVGIRLEVRNPLPVSSPATPGSRVGLVGLSERLALIGGTFSAAAEHGAFVVRAWVPWTS